MNEPYEAALNLAMNDLDELEPEFAKMRDRIIALKLIVKGTSTVLGKYDDIDDKYKFIPIQVPPRVPRQIIQRPMPPQRRS
jgi:hypothetical protein